MEANPPRRYSASQLPPDADPAEREFLGLLAKALAPSYSLIRRLGAGGMGTVYVARDPVLKRLVAVKVMSPELSRDLDARTRFSREAQAVAALSHPNVVAVYAVGELENGLPYIVMQYVEGRSMAERITEDGPLDIATAKRVLGEVASALSATHKKGIIHRDIKPANILWDDESGRALVTDFGIAAVRERADDRDAVKITQTGMAVGTPAYMSPEQFLAEPITEKTDIYALGLLGYELLVGEGPYFVKSPAELMAAHLRDAPRKLSTLRGEVDAELEQLLAACLTKDPPQRPSAEFVAKQLTHGASVLLEWPPPGLDLVTKRFSGAVFWLGVGGLLVCSALVVPSALEYDNLLRVAMPSAGAMLFVAVLGLAMLIGSAADLFEFFRQARRAVSRGYGWFTVAEVACDHRGDGGALIAGGREYAELSPTERNTLRVRRVADGGLRLAAATAPVVGFCAGLPLGTRMGGGPLAMVLCSLGSAVALFFASRVLRAMEGSQLGKSRARIVRARAARVDASPLGEAWTQTFDAVRSGQRLGAGRPIGVWKRAFAAPTVAALLALSIGSVMVLGFSVAALSTISEVALGGMGLVPTSTNDRVRRLKRLERLRLPVDSNLSPKQAAAMMRAAPAGRPDRVLSPFMIGDYMRQARRLSPAARDSLRMIASHPMMADFRMLAHARTFDYLGSRMSLDSLDKLEPWLVEVPKLGMIRSAAGANVAAAILLFADGKAAEAELRLRETLSVGFLLVREGNWLIETIAGVNIVSRARIGLNGLYEQTGRTADAAFVSPALDPEDVTVPVRQLGLDLRQIRVRALQIVGDTTLVRGLRSEALGTVAYLPCADVHQLVFGVDAGIALALTKARAMMVRFPSDSVLFLKASLALERPIMAGSNRVGFSAVSTIARIVDALTGSKRMRSCAWLLG